MTAVLEFPESENEAALCNTLYQQCSMALRCVCNPRGLAALAQSHPGIFLGVTLAKKVPQEDLESAIYACRCDFMESLAAFHAQRGSRWDKLAAFDDFLTGLACMYALLIRSAGCSSPGSSPDLHQIYQQVIDRYRSQDW